MPAHGLRGRFISILMLVKSSISEQGAISKKVLVLLLGFLILLSLGIYVGFPRSGPAEETKTLGLNTDDRIEVKPPRAAQDVNQTIEIPLEEDYFPLLLEIQKAELRDEVIIQGKRANTITGRTFLILTLKIVNDNSTTLSLNTRNFIRLSVNGNESEWLAPDIHNDPVEVQASSTKYTRLGFPLNDTDSNLTLRAGKLEGDKITILLDQLK